MNDYIVDSLISGEFTKEQKIEYTTNYLSKNQIAEDEAKRIIESLFILEYTKDGEAVIPDELVELQEKVIFEANNPTEIEALQQTVDGIFTEILPVFFE